MASVSYLPFGPMASLSFGNGRVQSRSYDANYGIDRVNDNASDGQDVDYGLDAVGNVTSLVERTGALTTVTRSFSYDGLDRLTAQLNAGSNVEAFSYNTTGDRLTKQVGVLPAQTYTYDAASHRLLAVDSTARTYDAVGSTLNDGTNAFAYDDRGRMSEHRVGAVLDQTYQTNGLGQRVAKHDPINPTNDLGCCRFHRHRV